MELDFYDVLLVFPLHPFKIKLKKIVKNLFPSLTCLRLFPRVNMTFLFYSLSAIKCVLNILFDMNSYVNVDKTDVDKKVEICESGTVIKDTNI